MYKTIDPEIQFETKVLLRKQGVPELYSETKLIQAMETADEWRHPIRASSTVKQLAYGGFLDYRCRSSMVYYISLLVHIIVENHIKTA